MANGSRLMVGRLAQARAQGAALGGASPITAPQGGIAKVLTMPRVRKVHEPKLNFHRYDLMLAMIKQ